MFTCHPRSQQVQLPASLRPEFGQMYLESHSTSLSLSVFCNAYSPMLQRLNCECARCPVHGVRPITDAQNGRVSLVIVTLLLVLGHSLIMSPDPALLPTHSGAFTSHFPSQSLSFLNGKTKRRD